MQVAVGQFALLGGLNGGSSTFIRKESNWPVVQANGT